MKKLIIIILCLTSLVSAAGIQRFGIFSPVNGIREDIPFITMPEAFTADNENVLLRYGEIHRAVLRNDELVIGEKSITEIADAGGSKTTVTVAGNGYANGETVTIDGLDSGSTEGYYDGDYTVESAATDTFVIDIAFVAVPNSYSGATSVIDSANNRAITPDGNPILEYHWFEKANGSDYLLCFTKAHAYTWDTVNEEWDLVFTCASDAETWSVVTMSDAVYATNNVDKIQTWSGTGSFADAGTVGSGLDTEFGAGTTYLTKAKFLVAFENYLLACNVVVGGTLYSQDIYWSDTGSPAVFNEGNASSVTIPGPDPLTTAIQLNDFLLVFSGRSIDSMWLVDSTMIFNRRRLHSSMGTYSPGSVARDINENVYFIDNHKNIRVIRSVMADIGSISAPIDKTLKLMPDSLLSGIRSDYIWDYDQIWWAVPYGPDATANNKVFCVDSRGAWTKLGIPVSAFGRYENKVTYAWDTLPYDNWLDWGWENWRSADVGADYKVDLCADYSGYTYGSHKSGLDSGDEFTGYAVLGTDFSQQKGTQAALYYKRLLKMTLIFRREAGGEADIYLKRDFETTWQDLGSVSLTGDTEILWKELNCDYRGRYFWLKISSTDHFRFIGVVFTYTPETTR